MNCDANVQRSEFLLCAASQSGAQRNAEQARTYGSRAAKRGLQNPGTSKPCTLTSFLCFESLGLRSAGPQDSGLVEKRDLRTRQG
jgi:hypothetical protein